MFRSTPLRDGRLQSVREGASFYVSIHAPARGATPGFNSFNTVWSKFRSTTVMEVLKHGEQMRPKRFKLAAIEVGYDGASAEPEAVVIIFFIGMKRLDGYSIGYDIKRNGKEIQLSVPKNPATDDTPIKRARLVSSQDR